MRAVEAIGLSASYGQAKVLDAISLSISGGEFVALMGAVGSGKTTLMLCLNGVIPKLIQATVAGSIRVFGKDVSTSSVQELGKETAFVFQDPDDQIFSLTVGEEVGFALKNRGLREEEIKKRVDEALHAVGLSGFSSRDPSTLSHGQKQKVCVASALASDAGMLLLDEPTSALDYRSSVELFELLRLLNNQGKTVLISSHDTGLLSEYAERFIVLDKSKILLDGGKEVLADRRFAEAGLRPPRKMKG